AVPLADPDAVDVLRPFLVRGSGVATFARHDAVAGQVWSAQMGYPGDPAYREFHRKDDRSGLRYWAVTDVKTDLGAKSFYSPSAAFERVKAHADHFVELVRDTLARRADRDTSALLTVTFDAELFGHWWFEGNDWLGRVLRELAARGPRPVTAAEYLRGDPPRARVELQEGSWGKKNDHSTWLNEKTEWMWADLRRMADEMTALRLVAHPVGIRERAARQAARE